MYAHGFRSVNIYFAVLSVFAEDFSFNCKYSTYQQIHRGHPTGKQYWEPLGLNLDSSWQALLTLARIHTVHQLLILNYVSLSDFTFQMLDRLLLAVFLNYPLSTGT